MSTVDIADVTDGSELDAGVGVLWTPAALVERGVVVLLSGDATGADTIDWGDGTRAPASGAALRHTYTDGRSYTVTALKGATVVGRETLHVRDGLKPAVTFAPAADNSNIVELTVNAEPADLISLYSVLWEPAGTAELKYLAKGDKLSHGFSAGDHPISVKDMHTGRALRETVTVVDPTYDPDFSVAKGADAMTAEVTLTTVETIKEILVDWGNGEQTNIPAPAVGTKVSHPYKANDTYIIQVVYADGSTDGSARAVTIPFPA